MAGSFNVVPNSAPVSNQADLDAAAASQHRGQTASALMAEAQAINTAERTNAGKKSATVIAGTESADHLVQVLEMLPRVVTLPAGQSATWKAVSADELHTVTFPQGHGSDPVDVFPFVCEGTSGDTPANVATGPPFFGCGTTPDSIELHFNPQPQGGTTITTGSVATSGAVTAIPNPFFPSQYTFSFSSPGTFAYQCRVHEHMTGQILAVAGD
jgi:plastocyanin